jgi:hypothetical protein
MASSESEYGTDLEGAVGGVLSLACTYPLFTIVVKVQPHHARIKIVCAMLVSAGP